MSSIALMVSSFILGLIVGSKYMLRRVKQQIKQGNMTEWLEWMTADDFNVFDWYRKWKQGEDE